MLVALIGIFLLLYGLWYPLKSDLWVYMTLIDTIYSVSVSTLLIAACYFKKSNEWGAYASIIIGALTPISFLVAQQIEVLKPYADKIGPYYSGIALFVFTWISMILGSYLKILFSKNEVK